jgi:hypothetical protein
MSGTFSTVIGDGRYRVETRTHEPHPGDVVTELKIFSLTQEAALLAAGRSPRLARAGALAVDANMLDAEIEDLVLFLSQLAARHGRERRAARKALFGGARTGKTVLDVTKCLSRGSNPRVMLESGHEDNPFGENNRAFQCDGCGQWFSDSSPTLAAGPEGAPVCAGERPGPSVA